MCHQQNYNLNIQISNNEATGSGGGIITSSQLEVHDSTIEGNIAGAMGAGVAKNGNRPSLLTNSIHHFTFR